MTRMNARWATDGFASKPADAAQVSTRRTQLQRTVTPRTLLSRAQHTQRGTTYTRRAGAEGAAVKQMNAVSHPDLGPNLSLSPNLRLGLGLP